MDALGLIRALMVLPASVRDPAGGNPLVEKLRGAVKRIKIPWRGSHFDWALTQAWVKWGWIDAVVRKLVGQVGLVVQP